MIKDMKKIINEMKLRLPAISENEAVCRAVISAFVAQLNPTVEQIADLRCAVSEAVTNCIVHAYENKDDGIIYMDCMIEDSKITVDVKDYGKGIEDVKKAKNQRHSTNPRR